MAHNSSNTRIFDAARAVKSLPALWQERGWPLKVISTGGERRLASPHCPQCGRGTRQDAVSIRLDGGTWRWHCFRCGCGGSVIDAVAHADAITPKAAAKKLLAEGGRLEAVVREQREARNAAASRKEAIIAEAVSAIASYQGRDRAVLAYLASRGIGEDVAEEARQAGLVRLMPGVPGAFAAWWTVRFGREALVEAGVCRADRRWPAVAYRPLVFVTQCGEGVEFRTIGNASGPKALQLGRASLPLVWQRGTPRRIIVCEGGIDMLSLAQLGLGDDAVLVGILGTGAWRGEWVGHFAGHWPDARWHVALDGDASGEARARTLLAALADAGIPGDRLTPWAGAKDWNDVLASAVVEFAAPVAKAA